MLGKVGEPPATVFHEGSGVAFNTVPPSDFGAFELINKVVQQEPATALDPELMGPLAAIGIVKGKQFAPDERMKKILTEAAALANATSRSLFMNPRDADWYYYPGSAWINFLFVTGSEFETPIPEITKEGVKPFPPTGYRTLNARTAFFYGITGITPAMSMRVTGIGSQYLFALLDADKNYFDGGEDLQGDAAQGHSGGELLVLHALRQPDPLDARHAAALSARWQPELSVAGRRGRAPTARRPSTSARRSPQACSAATGSRPCPAKGWFTILRLYSPLEPFFTKEWRPSEIELVN